MDKAYRKILIILFAVVLVLPQISFAAWWNPLTWSFPWLKKTAPQSQEIRITTSTIPTNVSNISQKKNTDPNISKSPKDNFGELKPKQSQPIAPPTTQTTLPPVVQDVQPPVKQNTPPPNTTLCNNTYYTNCSSNQDFVCPAIGDAYCQTSQQQQQIEYQRQQTQATATQQQKTGQINAITSQYNVQKIALDQQIIDIKNQYYKDLAKIENSPGLGMSEAIGEEQNLLNKDNALISQIQLQEQQLYLDYLARINTIR